MKNPKIKKAWESFYEKYKLILEWWCGFPKKEKRDKYINLPFEEWCEKERADLMAKYSVGALSCKTLTKQQQSYKDANKIKMDQIYKYFNMLTLMKSDYTISLEELCNIHIKPVLHLMTDTIYKEDFCKIKTITIAKWLKKNKKGINDIRIFLELPLTKKAHIAYDFYEGNGYLYDSQQEMKMANFLFQWLPPDLGYIPHERYPKSFYDFIKRENKAWTFLLDFTIIEKSTAKVLCNIEVWGWMMEQAKKQKEGNNPGFKKRMIEYCTKQGGRNDKEAFWKTQPIPFIGVERRELFTKKGRKELLERLKLVVPLEKRELSKEFLDDFHEKIKKIRKVGNYSAFANPEDHYEKKYKPEERKEFEDELKLMMEKNDGELPIFLTFQNNKCCLGPSFSHIIYGTNLYTDGFHEVCKRIGDTRENTIKKRAENNRDINMLRCHGLTADSTEDDIKDVFCKVFIDFLNTMKNGDYYSQEHWGKYSDKLPKKTFGRAAEGRVNRSHFGNLKNPWGKETKGKHDWFAKFRKDSIEWATKKKINFPNVIFEKVENYPRHKEKEAKFIKLVTKKGEMLLSPQTILRHLKKKKLKNPNSELTKEEEEEKVLMTWFKNCYEWTKRARKGNNTCPKYVYETFKKFKDIPIIKEHKYVKMVNS